jgi:hypothetical protein
MNIITIHFLRSNSLESKPYCAYHTHYCLHRTILKKIKMIEIYDKKM